MSITAGMEWTLDAMVAKLQTNLPAKITSINAEVTDGYTLDTPGDDDYSISVRADLQQYPFVMVLPMAAQPESDGGTRIEFVRRIQAISWISDYSEEALGRKLLRFQRAVFETIMALRNPGLTQGTGGWTIWWESDEFGPVFAPPVDGTQQQYFVQAARSVFTVKAQQDV
jgi:hypothetical protein